MGVKQCRRDGGGLLVPVNRDDPIIERNNGRPGNRALRLHGSSVSVEFEVTFNDTGDLLLKR